MSSPRARRLRSVGRSSNIESGGVGGGSPGSSRAGTEYTSLRDMLAEGGGGAGEHHHGHGSHGGSGGGRAGSCWRDYEAFDASNIGIRNQLLKHAASAYLQSAVVVAAAGPGGGGGASEGGWGICCLDRLLWQYIGCGGGGRRGRGRVLMRACSLQGCVHDSTELCAAFVARVAAFFTRMWT